MSFELEFRGRLSRWLRSQGLNVDRITVYRVTYDPLEMKGHFRVHYIDRDGTEKYASLPASLEDLMKAL